MPPDLIPDGPGLPGTKIVRVECPIHGDTWAFWPGNDPGGCMEDAAPGAPRGAWGGCDADPVRVTYVLASDDARDRDPGFPEWLRERATFHVNVCPECGDTDSGHTLDPPPHCGHAYDRRNAEPGVLLSDALAALEAREQQTERLHDALRHARPYVFNQTGGEDWRAEAARDVLARVDGVLRELRPEGTDA